jgi:putative ABC transport system permease protein
MRISILFKAAVHAILRHTGRSFLTILGIMVGVAAIIITFSIGRGAEEKIKLQINAMGEGTIIILPGNVITPGGTRSSLTSASRLTAQDLESIRDQITQIREISRGTFGHYLAEHKNNAVKEEVLGADGNIFKIFNKSEFAYGMAFNDEHITKRANVAIIGSKIYEKLFGKEFALNKTIRIGGFPFVVIGVLKKEPHYFGTEDPNARIIIPFTTAKKYFKAENELEDDLGYIAFALYPGAKAEHVVRIIKRVLRLRHSIEPGEEDDFLILDQESIAKTASSAGNIIKMFGLIAASISLLVGGIGIMNIMLVSVQERKKEIGLRIALGATQLTVQLQFLFESATLCAIGGLFGVVLGLLGQLGISRFTILPSVIEIVPPFVSLLITIGIGVFFGYYPARKASLLNPIDALLER